MSLFAFAKTLVEKAGKQLLRGEIFAKVLTGNDDSGRHGVLIPAEAYPFFPDLSIPDPTQNATARFSAFDSISAEWQTVAYKYYQRYPERRITRVNGVINDLDSGPRLFVALCAKHRDGTDGYYFDLAVSGNGGRFEELFSLIFGNAVTPTPGEFIIRPIDSPTFEIDPSLARLLALFDGVKARGWINTLRSGDTGIGYTFESLIGIEENNESIADFEGIEIKCQGVKEGRIGSGSKINLFQEAPVWVAKLSTKERIRLIGKLEETGRYTCYSQVSTLINNLGLLLFILHQESVIDLRKHAERVAYWSFQQLQQRLAEKHSKAAFVKAKIRPQKGGAQYWYQELVYCHSPSIQRFVDLVEKRNIVFEFTMSEKEDGSVRNHGYPWRLTRSDFLDHLFAFQIQLRTATSV